MRRVVDLLLGVMLVCILGGAVLYVKYDRTNTNIKDTAREERRRFQQQISLQTALEQGDLNDRGFPTTIEPSWFNGNPPGNPLIGASNPWVEIAASEQQFRLHPHDPVALHAGQARFWYNPWTGVIRARVPAGVSDRATLNLYNYVNEVQVDSLFPKAEDRH